MMRGDLATSGKGSAADRLPKLQHSLVLHRYFGRLLGSGSFAAIRATLQAVRQDAHEDGHSHFFHALLAVDGLAMPPGTLAAYDLRIQSYVERMNRFRTPQIRLTYFQYLALLLTEAYLDRLATDAGGLLSELNSFVARENESLPSRGWRYPAFTAGDLHKIAFWMATGSGKTLLLHVNLWQHQQYFPSTERRSGVLLITPNEGLSRQHLAQFRASGIPAERYGEPGGGRNDEQPVTVIEITKLTENKRGAGQSVNVDEFESYGLILVDEGHRGASGDVWRGLRERVAEGSFTFEYSATFGQMVNGASASRRAALLEEYSKAILFDYSYPYFYGDGYGKDYWIINLDDETNTFNDWVMLGNLLSFYEQALVYAQNRDDLRPYHLEAPLWVFVGHSVTGGAGRLSRDDQVSLTDVEEVVAFFDRFLRQPDQWRARIGRLLSGETGLRSADGADLFAGLLPVLRSQGRTAACVYDDVVRLLFHARPGDTLSALELRSSPGEIGLRVGAGTRYFGVINIGDVPGLMRLLEQGSIRCGEENFTPSLFHGLNDADSPVTVLIGSRKFMEGWDSFRVSSLGLMNIGRGEGSQIVQLFGRGVRLRGKGYSLKRTSALPPGEAPPHIHLLETLNIFGVRANYMAQFRSYLKQEGIEPDFQEIRIPMRIATPLLDRGLQMLRLDKPFGESVPLRCDSSIRVTLDLRPRLELAASGSGRDAGAKADGDNKARELKRLAPLLDWQRIMVEMLLFKRSQQLHTLAFTESTLRQIITEGDYELLCTETYLPPASFAQLVRARDACLGILQKYVAAYYHRERRSWERDHLELSAEP